MSGKPQQVLKKPEVMSSRKPSERELRRLHRLGWLKVFLDSPSPSTNKRQQTFDAKSIDCADPGSGTRVQGS